MIAIGLRESLREQLQEQATIFDHLDDAAAKTNGFSENDQLLIDSVTTDQNELRSFVLDHPGLHIIYITESASSALTAFASAEGIRLLSHQQLIQYLDSRNMQSQTPVLAFWGVFPRLGTTMIALSVAKVLFEQHGKSVGVLGLNGYDPGNWMLQSKDHHLGDMASFLNHKPNRETLLSSMENVGGVKYLPGLRNPTQALRIGPTQVQNLIDAASTVFDIVILDLGSIPNTALALEGLRLSTHRYVVANDLLSTQQRFFDYFDYVLKPLGIDQNQLLLIGSQLHGSNKLNSFAKVVNLFPVAGVPYFPSIDLFGESRSDAFKLFFDEKTFKKAVEAIAVTALAEADLNEKGTRIKSVETVRGGSRGVLSNI